MGLFDSLFCTDEDVATLIGSDWGKVVPAHQIVAEGSDGVIDADNWTLRSNLNDPATRGVQPGMVIILVTGAVHENDLLGVDSVNVAPAAGVVMRRINFQQDATEIPLASLLGQPPYPGGKSGVKFTVRTLFQQINESTRVLKERYRLLSNADLQSPTDFRRAAALMTAAMSYLNAVKEAGKVDSDFRAKYIFYNQLLDDYLMVLDATYGPASAQQGAVVIPMAPIATIRMPDGLGRVIPAAERVNSPYWYP